MHANDLTRSRARDVRDLAAVLASASALTVAVWETDDRDDVVATVHAVAKAVGLQPLRLSAAAMARETTVASYARLASGSDGLPVMFVTPDADAADRAVLRDTVGRLAAHAHTNGFASVVLIVDRGSADAVEDAVTDTCLYEYQIHRLARD